MSRDRWRPVAAALLAAALGGCSSVTGAGHTTTSTTSTTRPTVVSPAPGTSGPTGVVTPPLEVAQASIEISGATVTVTFAPRVVTSRLRVDRATFGAKGLSLTFSVDGVRYAGDATASGLPGGLIARVTVSGTGSAATVLVDLARGGTGHRFTFGHHSISVQVS